MNSSDRIKYYSNIKIYSKLYIFCFHLFYYNSLLLYLVFFLFILIPKQKWFSNYLKLMVFNFSTNVQSSNIIMIFRSVLCN
jgi:hypothetical protein